MNGFDIAVVALTGVLIVVGLLNGIIRILVGLAALTFAFLAASRLHQPLADTWATESPSAPLRLLAYLSIFVGVMLLGGVTAWFLRKLIKVAMLGWADRLAGAALGFVSAALATALVILPVVAYTPTGETLLEGSVVAPYVSVVTDVVNQVVPDDMARRYRERMDELRRRWRGDDDALSAGRSVHEGSSSASERP